MAVGSAGQPEPGSTWRPRLLRGRGRNCRRARPRPDDRRAVAWASGQDRALHPQRSDRLHTPVGTPARGDSPVGVPGPKWSGAVRSAGCAGGAGFCNWLTIKGSGQSASTSVVEPPERTVQTDGTEVVGGALRVPALVGAVKASAVPAGRQAPQRGEIHHVALWLSGAGEPGLH